MHVQLTPEVQEIIVDVSGCIHKISNNLQLFVLTVFIPVCP